MESKKSINRIISKALQKFTVSELKKDVLRILPGLTWELVEKCIERYYLSLKKRDIVKIIAEYTETNCSLESAREIAHKLLILDLSLHSNRKLWFALSMKNVKKHMSKTTVVDDIKNSLEKISLPAEVYRSELNEICFLLVVIETRFIFLAHPLNSQHLFHSPKFIPSKRLKGILDGFGCTEYKPLKLNGKNIFSLVKMLNRNKDSSRIRKQLVIPEKALSCVRTQRGYNFLQDDVRADHANQLFGDDSLRLQTLTVEAECTWRGLQMLPELSGKLIKTKLKIKSSDVQDTLKQFVKEGAILQPYPNWCKEFSISGKNELKIGLIDRENNSM